MTIGTMIETRTAYGEALAELGKENEKLVVMDADLSGSTKTSLFAKAFPDRFFNAGIAEGNMASVAAGLAAAGMTVCISSFAIFAAGRAFEQIRNSVVHSGLNVKVCATHAGITVGPDGATHQSVEDVALMRSIPHMTVLCPADAVEAKQALFEAVKFDGPVYLRYGRGAVPVIFDENDFTFRIGKGALLRDGSDVTIVSCGIMTAKALEAANILASQGVSARVVHMASVKPIDREILLESAYKTKAFVTAEEHNVIGGLGGAVCETLSEACPRFVERVGVRDRFGASGKVEELLSLYGLTAEEIAAAALRALQKANA